MAIREPIYYGGRMAYDYDKLYGETNEALGQPTPIFVDFFAALDMQNLRVLDVGCGQGRDAIFIARLGHRVVGVDVSPNGIRSLRDAAETENLPIEGCVADIATYASEGTFDVVLIDRRLHMLDLPTRLAVLARLLDHVAENGWVLIADEASNVGGLEKVRNAHDATWETLVRRRGYLFLHRT